MKRNTDLKERHQFWQHIWLQIFQVYISRYPYLPYLPLSDIWSLDMPWAGYENREDRNPQRRRKKILDSTLHNYIIWFHLQLDCWNRNTKVLLFAGEAQGRTSRRQGQPGCAERAAHEDNEVRGGAGEDDEAWGRPGWGRPRGAATVERRPGWGRPRGRL